MHIMEIVSGVGLNGATRHPLLLAGKLRERGHRVSLVARPNSWIAEQASAESGIEVLESDQHRLPTDELRRVARYVQATDVDVVHTHSSRAHFFGVLLRLMAATPTVATAHNRYIQPHWMFNDLVVAPSQATLNFHHRFNLVRRNRLVQINNFVEPSQFEVAREPARRAIRSEFGLDETTTVLGVIGDVCRRKGLNYLVEALPKLNSERYNVQVLAVGGKAPGFTKEVETLARRLGVESQLHLTGRRNDIATLMAAVDMFVLPSNEEQQPLSTLEAMAARLPTVTTDVGGLSDCVVDRVTGRLVPARDPIALADAIRPLVQDAELRRRYGEAGRRRLEEHFSIDAMVSKLEAEFVRLTRRRRGLKSESNMRSIAKTQ